MPTLAMALLKGAASGPEVVEYLTRIDATLAPFGGRYLVHGGPIERVEGDWSGDPVIIAFPDRASARGWYDSPAYRAIRPLRTGTITGDVIFVDTVPEDHRATDILAAAGHPPGGGA
ncbi:DUF1330 domain-containing protein [Azospirillum halopraeferens]|uniref:DUF1330 domain-containing protein n=1 Tax=Azospirillum halopraeferens TaxID=34010 RepID=UPI0004094D2E|nr:DUF1330 domain-containing protein [Azospirillum halopraeferens]